MKVVLVAEEAAGVKTLRMLMSQPLDLLAVVTSRSASAGASVEALARSSGCEIWPAHELTDPKLGQRLRQAEVDLLLNVHSLHLLRREVLSAPRIGSFNLHPGPLPRYAGLNAPSWAVYNGEKCHAVTLHWMAPGIDTGPIAYETVFDLGPQDTGFTVSAACVRHGLPLIERLLGEARADPARIPRVAQDLAQRRMYSRRAVPYEGRLPWSRSGEEIVRFIRACDFHPLPSPWGHPWTRAGEERIEAIKARLEEGTSGAPPGTVVRVEGTEAWVASADRPVVLQKVRRGDQVVAASEAVSAAMSLEWWRQDR